MANCPLCNFPLIEQSTLPNNGDGERFNCTICGTFNLSRTVISKINGLNNKQKALVRYYIKRKVEKESDCLFGFDDIENILKSGKLPNHREQEINLIISIGNEINKGKYKELNPDNYIAKIGALDSNNVRLILEHWIETDILIGKEEKRHKLSQPLTLSMIGWDKYEELKASQSDSKYAFMAMGYNDVTDEAYKKIFKPAIESTGFELKVQKDEKKLGLIDNRMILNIQQSKFLIVDLTDDNAGAYWESGYAEGLGKPVFYVCEEAKFKEKKPHFDTNHRLTTMWNLDDPEYSIEELKATIFVNIPEAKR